MGTIFTSASMSLDGYIAGPAESGFEHLFAWYGNGDVEVPTAQPDRTFRMSGASAGHFRDLLDRTGALVVGRRLFELTGGWGGTHPLGLPVVVCSHNPPPDWVTGGSAFTFADTIERAVEVARDLAGVRAVVVSGGTIARQCVDAGLLDEVWIDLVPVLLGSGVPLFPTLAGTPVQLDGPTVIEGDGVTHLRYAVRR